MKSASHRNDQHKSLRVKIKSFVPCLICVVQILYCWEKTADSACEWVINLITTTLRGLLLAPATTADDRKRRTGSNNNKQQQARRARRRARQQARPFVNVGGFGTPSTVPRNIVLEEDWFADAWDNVPTISLIPDNITGWTAASA